MSKKIKNESAESTKKTEVRFITSLAMMVNDIDGNTRHVQLTIVQNEQDKQFGCFFDVVDPTKIKLAESDE